MIDSISFKITRTFTRQQVIDLLSSALEGGSNYWYTGLDYQIPDERSDEVEEASDGVFRGYWAPFAGGRMTLEIQENSAGIPYWDGEGWAEWISTERPIIGLAADHSVDGRSSGR